MTKRRSAGMAFMTKKKKYKFQIEFYLEELLEVPFVSAVLFAKLRLLDGGFQDHSPRVEVAEHAVKWGSRFSFACKMLANASTGVLEPCILRISIRKECKGGRSFTKLGFVDLNLAEFAGAGETSRKALLEGYDSRRRQDNSMLRFSLKMNMLSGDILFKVPSPSLKHKAVVIEDTAIEPRPIDDYSSGSLAGSIASASSGFGSLPKKRPPLLQSDLVLGQFSNDNVPVTIASDIIEPLNSQPEEEVNCEPGHSRNSSNTSQMSKASGYSSIHSHSRQSSSGDSGHIRDLQKPKWFHHPSSVSYHNAKNSLLSHNEEIYSTPKGLIMPPRDDDHTNGDLSTTIYSTPKCYHNQTSNISSSSVEEYKTPDSSINGDHLEDTFVAKFNAKYPNDIQKNCSCVAVEQRLKNMTPIKEMPDHRLSDNLHLKKNLPIHQSKMERASLDERKTNKPKPLPGVLRSKSDFEIPRQITVTKPDSIFHNFAQKSDALFSFLTPKAKRKTFSSSNNGLNNQSTPKQNGANVPFKVPASPILKYQRSLPGTRTTSPTLLKSRLGAPDGQQIGSYQLNRNLPHRKLLEGNSGGKLAPVAISPDETSSAILFDCSQNSSVRRPSITTNPSSSSLVLSDTGSLDRAKAALERRKKAQPQEADLNTVSGRVETTRVNPDDLIEELIKNTNLEPTDDSAENSGLQLFIAKDGTAALGNHEVKSKMSTGVQLFKQVVVEDKR